MGPHLWCLHGIRFANERGRFECLFNLLLIHHTSGAREKEQGRARPRLYALPPVLKEMLGREEGVLSNGQQQQLAIGRAAHGAKDSDLGRADGRHSVEHHLTDGRCHSLAARGREKEVIGSGATP